MVHVAWLSYPRLQWKDFRKLVVDLVLATDLVCASLQNLLLSSLPSRLSDVCEALTTRLCAMRRAGLSLRLLQRLPGKTLPLPSISTTIVTKTVPFIADSQGKFLGDNPPTETNVYGSQPHTMLRQMALKSADISHAAKSLDLHVQWSERIQEEFFVQGDEEKNLEIEVRSAQLCSAAAIMGQHTGLSSVCFRSEWSTTVTH